MSNITKVTPFVVRGLLDTTQDGAVVVKSGTNFVYTQSLTLNSLSAGTVSYSGEVLTNSTSALQVPTGTSAQRPSSGSGKIRFNTDLSRYEGFAPSTMTWSPLNAGGATGGGTNYVFYENDTNVFANYTITAGKNAGSFGPITIEDGFTVTIPDGTTWTIV